MVMIYAKLLIGVGRHYMELFLGHRKMVRAGGLEPPQALRPYGF